MTTIPAARGGFLARRHARIRQAISWLLVAPGLVYLLSFFLYPLALTVWTSLHTADGSLSLDTYRAVLTSPARWRVIRLTLFLALSTTLASVMLAIPLALLLRMRIRGLSQRLLRVVVLTPLTILALISALGLLIIWGDNGWLNRTVVAALPFVDELRVNFTIPGLVLFYTWLYSPYTILMTLSAIEGVDPNIEEAARVSGARPHQVLLRVTLPLALPGIRAGSILTFLLSFGAFSVPLIASGNNRPLSVVIYTEAAVFNNWQTGSALATIMAVLAVVTIALYLRLSTTRAARSQR
jgi:putative spermidine/putrescine transport system permease protein